MLLAFALTGWALAFVLAVVLVKLTGRVEGMLAPPPFAPPGPDGLDVHIIRERQLRATGWRPKGERGVS